MAFILPIVSAVGSAMATAAPYLSVASAGIGALGAIRAGNAQAANYKSQQQAIEYNASIQRNNAQSVGQQANAAEEAQRRKAAAMRGEALAAIGQSGTGYDGSNMDMLRQGDANAELDALNIRYQGQMNYSGLMAQSELDQMQARQAGRNASDARAAGYVGAATSLLSGVAKYGAYKGYPGAIAAQLSG